MLDQDLAERLGLVQHPGVHGRDEGVAADEVHLQSQDAEEEVAVAAGRIHEWFLCALGAVERGNLALLLPYWRAESKETEVCVVGQFAHRMRTAFPVWLARRASERLDKLPRLRIWLTNPENRSNGPDGELGPLPHPLCSPPFLPIRHGTLTAGAPSLWEPPMPLDPTCFGLNRKPHGASSLGVGGKTVNRLDSEPNWLCRTTPMSRRRRSGRQTLSPNAALRPWPASPIGVYHEEERCCVAHPKEDAVKRFLSVGVCLFLVALPVQGDAPKTNKAAVAYLQKLQRKGGGFAPVRGRACTVQPPGDRRAP